MRLRAQLPFLVILLALCAPGCADFDRGPAAEGDGGGGGSTPPPTGSASFEILRYLVERLPIMITPRWVRTPCQPIATITHGARNLVTAAPTLPMPKKPSAEPCFSSG